MLHTCCFSESGKHAPRCPPHLPPFHPAVPPAWPACRGFCGVVTHHMPLPLQPPAPSPTPVPCPLSDAQGPSPPGGHLPICPHPALLPLGPHFSRVLLSYVLLYLPCHHPNWIELPAGGARSCSAAKRQRGAPCHGAQQKERGMAGGGHLTLLTAVGIDHWVPGSQAHEVLSVGRALPVHAVCQR